TAASELFFPPPPVSVYNPNAGLGPGASATLSMTFAPASLGPKLWDVAILSNDTTTPQLHLAVKSEAVLAPGCNLSIDTGAAGPLDFGLVAPGLSLSMPVRLTNAGAPADTCWLWNIELAPGSDGEFSLPAGTLDALELAGGQTA